MTERQLRPQESTAARVVRTAMQASAAITAARQQPKPSSGNCRGSATLPYAKSARPA
jgi:hypothetical protein